MSGKSICVIGDMQVKPEHDLAYASHIGEYIAEKRPDIIVCIGDFYDFESLSSYDRGKASFEGRRLIEDIRAGNEAMERLMDPIQKLQSSQKFFKKKVYRPEMHFTLGNHEDRADRAAKDNPELQGFIGTELLDIERWGWQVHPFLKPVNVEGIYFVHYLANPMTGKPYAGTAMAQLKTVGNSFVVGHKQCLDVAIRPTLDGKQQIGIINGASYPHFEDYKGYVGNNHFRGITMLYEVKDGFGLPAFISLDYLAERYS